MNAGAFEKAFSDILGFSFLDIPQGGQNGLEIPCAIEKGEFHTVATLKLYKPASKPEKRLWLMGLKQWAKAGDILTFENIEATVIHENGKTDCKIHCFINRKE